MDRGGRTGQAVVEFALAVPIFIMLIFGMIDLARYFFIEQSVSHTLREAARYAVTGQLADNTDYDSDDSGSFPYRDRRASIIAAAQANNPAGFPIIASPSGYSTNDNFTIMSSSNFAGPWLTNSTTGLGEDFIQLSLRTDFYFITPFLNLIMSSLNGGDPLSINGSLIMRNENFETNVYSDGNDQGSSTNYWN